MIRRVVTGTGFALLMGLAATILSGCHAGPLTLSGRLTTAGGRGAAHVRVGVYTADSRALVASAVTDADGSYALGADDLPDGTYKIEFGQPDVNLWWNGAATFADATPVTATAAAPATVDAQLPSGSIAGTVTDSDGPVAGATVEVENGDGPAGSAVATVSTDANGAYVVDALVPGGYRVVVAAPDHATRYVATAITGAAQVTDAEVVTVVDGAHSSGHDVELPAESTISGTVVDGAGPVGGVWVVAFDATDGAPRGHVATAGDGRFTLHGLNPVASTIGLFDPTGEHAVHVVGETDGRFDPGQGNGTTYTPVAGGTVSTGTISIPGKACTPDRFGTSVDLTHAGLAGADLSSCDLTRANLSSADLSGADLTAANLAGNGLLKGADLSNVDLSRATLTGTNLTDLDLSTAVLTGVTSGALVGAPARLPAEWQCKYGYLFGPGANLAGADLRFQMELRAGISAADLTGADLANATFAGFTFTDTVFTGAQIAGADFSQAVLDGPTSGGVTGAAKLPSGWQVANGFLVGPGAVLEGADLTGADLTSVDLTGADLTDADCSNATIDGTIFNGATLTGLRSFGVVGTPVWLPTGWVKMPKSYLIGPGADVSGANLRGTIFEPNPLNDLSLAGVDFSGTDLTGASFDHLDLSHAIFTDADLSGVTFTEVTLTYVSSGGVIGVPTTLPTDWALYEGYLVGPGAVSGAVDFADHDLKGLHLDGVDFTGADLSGAKLTDQSLAYAVLTGADLRGAHLAGSEARSAVASGADFSGADLTNVDFTDADLTGADLSGATVTGVDFLRTTVTSMRPVGTVGVPALLPDYWVVSAAGFIVGPGADLSEADLTGADLGGTTLIHVDLDGTNLTDAKLKGVNLSSASMVGTTLSGADLTDSTLTGVVSSGIVGVPAALPAGWSLVDGVLVPS